MTPDMAVVTPLNNPGGPEGDTVTVDEQLLNTEYCVWLLWPRMCPGALLRVAICSHSTPSRLLSSHISMVLVFGDGFCSCTCPTNVNVDTVRLFTEHASAHRHSHSAHSDPMGQQTPPITETANDYGGRC
jgi:hypothetical protein